MRRRPVSRDGSEFTRDFECLVASLATWTTRSLSHGCVLIDSDTVAADVERVCAEELDPATLGFDPSVTGPRVLIHRV